MVTPSLRSVAVGTPSPGRVLLRFTYEHLSSEDSELPSEVAAELAADLPDMDIDILLEIAGVDVSRALAAGERWIYLRREVLPTDE